MGGSTSSPPLHLLYVAIIVIVSGDETTSQPKRTKGKQGTFQKFWCMDKKRAPSLHPGLHHTWMEEMKLHQRYDFYLG